MKGLKFNREKANSVFSREGSGDVAEFKRCMVDILHWVKNYYTLNGEEMNRKQAVKAMKFILDGNPETHMYKENETPQSFVLKYPETPEQSYVKYELNGKI